MIIVALDIGSTIGWAVIDAAREKVVHHGQHGYFDPWECVHDWAFSDDGEPDAFVMARPTLVKWRGREYGTHAVAKHAYRCGQWEGYLMGRGHTVHMISEGNKPKAKRLVELCALTGTSAGDWKEHEADAACLGLKWARSQVWKATATRSR